MIIKGYWWLPSNPEKSIAGVLTFNGTERSTLELFGHFDSLSYPNYRKFDPNACPLILGIGEKGEKYSLLYNICGPYFSTTFVLWPITIDIILEGIHLTDVDQKCFNGELLSFKNLRDWYRKELIEVQEEENHQIYKCKLDISQDCREIALSDGSKCIIAPTRRNSFVGRNDEIHLFQSTQIALSTSEEFSARDFLSKARILQQFVSLLFLSPQYFDGINLKEDGNDYYEVKMYVRNDTTIKPFFGAFMEYDIIKDKLDDIIRKWFEYSEELYPIQNHLFRTLDPGKSIGNEDFLVVAQAIDGLTKTRIQLTGNLKGRVKQLYNILSGVFRLQNNKMNAEVFAKTRNFYAHMAKDKDYKFVAKGEGLIVLLQQSKLLLTCALLNIYGLSDNEIDKCLAHSPFTGWWHLNMKLPTD